MENSPTKCDDEKVTAITMPFGRRQWQSSVYRWRFLDVWELKMVVDVVLWREMAGVHGVDLTHAIDSTLSTVCICP